jgi:hypothetical protein
VKDLCDKQLLRAAEIPAEGLLKSCPIRMFLIEKYS